MKQYVIDQLRESDFTRIRDFLHEHAETTALEEVYRMELPEHLYGAVQAEHSQCQPYYFAVNLNRHQVAFEWLIRSRKIMRCHCIAYASPEQREHIVQVADGMLEELGIKI